MNETQKVAPVQKSVNVDRPVNVNNVQRLPMHDEGDFKTGTGTGSPVEWTQGTGATAFYSRATGALLKVSVTAISEDRRKTKASGLRPSDPGVAVLVALGLFPWRLNKEDSE